MNSPLIDTPAKLIAEKMQSLPLSPALKGYWWVPFDLPQLPCALVGLPDIRLKGIDEAEKRPYWAL